MNKEEKIKIVGDLTDQLKISKNIYFTDISGLNAEQTSGLRRMSFNQGVVVSVVKNTLLKKAMDACDKDFSNFDDLLKGNTTLMISDVSNAPAKIIKSFLTKTQLDTPVLKGSYIEESIYLGHDKLDILVSLKSKDELLGDLILLLQSPIKNVISSLGSAKQSITGILQSLESNPIKTEEPAAEEPAAEEPVAEEPAAEEPAAEEPAAEELNSKSENDNNLDDKK